MASYPSSTVSFSTRTPAQTIAAAHMNAVQDEITAIEQGLISGFQHHVKPNVTDTYNLGSSSERWSALYLSGLIDASKVGTHLFSGSGVGAVGIRVRNSAAGTANKGLLEVGNDTASDLGTLEALSSTFTPAGARFADGVALLASGAGGLSLAALHGSGLIRFYAGSTTLRMSLAPTELRTFFTDGEVRLRNGLSNIVECHLRAMSGKKAYQTWAEDAVADRWALGIENGDSALYLRIGLATSTTIAAKVLSTGSWGFPLQPRVLAYKSSNQSITSGAGFTSVGFNTESYDIGGLHDTTSNDQRFVVVEDGIYEFGAVVTWAAQTGGTRSAQILKNGLTVLVYTNAAPTADAVTQFIQTPPVSLVAGDYLTLAVSQNSGSSVNVVGGAEFTQAWMRRIG